MEKKAAEEEKSDDEHTEDKEEEDAEPVKKKRRATKRKAKTSLKAAAKKAPGSKAKKPPAELRRSASPHRCYCHTEPRRRYKQQYHFDYSTDGQEIVVTTNPGVRRVRFFNCLC